MSGAPAWERIETVYREALKRGESERETFLAEACGDDEELRSEVRSLLSEASEAASGTTTAAVSLGPGVRLGEYRVESTLGTGGMGVVYLATDPRLGRSVAIKVLPPDVAHDPVRRRRFEREARLTAALSHPNIATIHEIGEHEGAPFIVMERIEGQTMRQFLEAGPVPVRTLLRMAAQIASGLARAHRAGILHRDLKPGNLMVTPDGLVKLLDFGLAKRVGGSGPWDGELTTDGTVVGTVHYMSPEQAKGQPLDERSDQFSLGSILYEMATGERPFARPTVSESLAAILEHESRPLAAAAPELPAEFAAVVMRCLSKDPSKRYVSTAELAGDLERLAAEASSGFVAAVRPAVPRWIWAAGGLFAVAVVVLAVLVGQRPDPPPPPRPPLEPVPLTIYPGAEREPTFSPDGSQVAFSWNGESQDNFDIYVKAVGSEPPLRLTTDPAEDRDAAWSPDGGTIAFRRNRPEGGAEVRLIPPTGGTERWLADVAEPRGLSWSVDGRHLAASDWLSPEQSESGIVLLDVATGSREPLVFPPAGSGQRYSTPAFSPDGRALAFQVRPEGRLMLFDLDGGEVRELTPSGAPLAVGWLSDSSGVVFSARVDVDADGRRVPGPGVFTGRVGLWLVPSGGGLAQELTGTAGQPASVATSRRGDRLAYTEIRPDYDLWRVDLRPDTPDAGRLTPLVATSVTDGDADVAPDGGRIAFTSNRTGAPEIWLADREGGSLLPLTRMGERGDVGGASWSPDGESIAFDFVPTAEPGRVDVYVVSAAGGAPRRMTTHPGRNNWGSWSRDGAWLYFSSDRSGRPEVWKVAVADGDDSSAVQVTPNGGWEAQENAEGTYLYFSDPKFESPSLWRLPLVGGEPELVVEVMAHARGWDLTAEGVFYLVRSDGPRAGTEIHFLAFGSESPLRLVDLPYASPFLSVSPDGTWAASTERRTNYDLMLVNDFR